VGITFFFVGITWEKVDGFGGGGNKLLLKNKSF
jgi:hypothetical protein